MKDLFFLGSRQPTPYSKGTRHGKAEERTRRRENPKYNNHQDPPGPPRSANLRTMPGPYSWYCDHVSCCSPITNEGSDLPGLPLLLCGNKTETRVSGPAGCRQTRVRTAASCA